MTYENKQKTIRKICKYESLKNNVLVHDYIVQYDFCSFLLFLPGGHVADLDDANARSVHTSIWLDPSWILP